MKIGMFSDIHFQPKGLERIIDTGKWIVEEFERQRIDVVHCLGDVLNTREDVSVAALSAASQFFGELAKRWPTHIVLGNHDMNLKHDRHISSLDGLALHPNIKIHSEIGLVSHPGHTALMLPYHEDQSIIVATIQKLCAGAPDLAKQLVAYGHLGINGAVQITRYATKFAGAVGPDAFKGLKRTFTGHFHPYQDMAHRVTYLGSPLQFNFGDAGDDRGIVIYDTDKDSHEFVRNPHCQAFHVLPLADIGKVAANPEAYRGSFITVVYPDLTTEDQHKDLTDQLTALGVARVERESVVDKAIRDCSVQVDAVQVSSVLDLVAPFVASVLGEDRSKEQELVTTGRGIIQQVNSEHQDVADTGALFDADIDQISAQNFFGIQDRLTIDFGSMANGVWLFEGLVGAGKSTVLEALVWCLFGEVVRSDTKVDDVINDVIGRNCLVSVSFKNGYIFKRFRKYTAEEQDASGAIVSYEGHGVKVFHNGIYQASFEKGVPTATQQAINDLLGIDFDTFTKSKVLGQSLAVNFISAGDKVRREIIERMLGLERFDSYLAHTREIKRTLSNELDQQNSIQQLKAGELTRIHQMIQEIERQITQVKSAHKQKVDRQAESVEVIRKLVHTRTQESQLAPQLDPRFKLALEEAEAKLLTFEIGQLAAKRETDKLRDQIEALRFGELQKATNVVSTLSSQRSLWTQRVDGLKAEIKRIIGELPLAMNPINILEGKKAVALIDQDIERLKSDHIKAIIRVDAATSKAQELTADIQRIAQLVAAGSAGEHCTTCHQILDQQAMNHLLEEKKTQVPAIIAENTIAREEVTRLAQELVTKNILRSTTLSTFPSDAEIAANEQQADSCDGRHKRAQAELANAEKELATFDGASAEATLANITKEFEELKQQFNIANALYDLEAHSLLSQAVRSARILNDEHNSLIQSKNNELQLNLKAAVEQLAAEETTLKNMAEQDLTRELQITKKTQEGQWAQVQQDLDNSKATATALGNRQQVIAFWDKAFAAKGGMRSFLLEESVKGLNRLIAGYMETLSLQGHSLSFNADLTVSERWGKRSGGQRKVVDISVLLGMREIVSQRSRFRAHFLFMDEVFDALDQQHRKAVQDLLTSLSARVGKVFVITHADFAGVSMAGRIQAKLTTSGTTIDIKKT